MPMRITGMNSGLDTETIIQELVKVRQKKVDDKKKEQTKAEWKQDVWKDLNTKIKNFQSKHISNMRFSSAYTKQTTKVSNSNLVSVITGEGAITGTQSLRVQQLAKTGYLTGGKIQGASGRSLSALSKLSDIKNADGTDAFTGGDGKLTLKIGQKPEAGNPDNRKTVEIDVNADTSISDVMTALKNQGLNASFDTDHQRFFISSKDSGAKYDFELTGSDLVGEQALKALGLQIASAADGTTNADGTAKDGYATKTDGRDAIIYLNDAKFTGSSNTFKINGLTITALGETQNGEQVSLTTERDTNGIYDMIKNFLKDYNSLVNEMDKMYNADSAKGYEPLTDDEKEEMSDKEVEEWEKKIKESLLRRDSDVSAVNSALQDIMSRSYDIDGESWHISDFGIDTLSYFSAEDNEKHAYHIDGDPDDSVTSSKEDVLKTAIAYAPDKVISFFTKVSQTMYEKMTALSKSQAGYRTFGNFYDDTKMKSDYESYASKIKTLESELNDYEDKWYSKFSAMETALAKMQSNANAITSLLGG